MISFESLKDMVMSDFKDKKSTKMNDMSSKINF